MKNKRILILGSYGHGNLGDDAILISILTAFKDIIPHARITIFCKDMGWIGDKFDIDSLNTWDIKNLFKIFNAHRHADLFILGGGGLIQDKTSVLNLIFWYVHIIIAKIFSKPVMCYAVGVGPIDSRLGKFLTSIILNKVDLITVRDNTSKNALNILKVNKPPIYVTADPAILLPPQEPDIAVEILENEGVIKGDNPLIAICIFYWFHSKKFLPVKFVLEKNLWTKREKEKFIEFKTSIAKLGDYLVDKLNAHLVFIPMKKTDYNAAVEIVELMKSKCKVSLINERYSPSETKSILGQMELTIGMHLHSLILSSSMYVPIFGLDYDPKIIGFTQLIDQKNCICPISDGIDINVLFTKLDEVWSRRDEIKRQFHSKIDELKDQSLLNAKLAYNLLESSKPKIEMP